MSDQTILVEHNASPMKLEVLAVDDWPEETLSVSCFEKQYPQTVTVFVVEGRAVLQQTEGDKNFIGEGDLVTFLPETVCTWQVLEPLTIQSKTG